MLVSNLPLRSRKWQQQWGVEKMGFKPTHRGVTATTREGIGWRWGERSAKSVYAAIGVTGLAQVYVAIRESDDALFGKAR